MIRAREQAEKDLRESVIADNAVATIEAAQKVNLKLGKEILAQFANALAGRAAYYQPVAGNQYADEKKFLRYTELAIYAADKLAPYESPRLAAVMVGQAQTRKIEVVGGLPGPNDVPMLSEAQFREAMTGVGPDAIDGNKMPVVVRDAAKQES